MRSYTVLLAVLITAAQAQEEPLPPTNLPLLDDAVEQCSHSGALECYALLAEVAERLPGEAWPQFYLGLVLHQGGIDAAEATRAYERALALDPGHVDALCNLGKMRSDAVRAEGPSDAAVALWTRALEIDPLHRMARVNLALDLHRRGRFDAATVHWDELLRRHPADPEVLYNAGVTRAHRGEVPVAADLYQACLERAPDHVEARINLAALYHKHGTPRDAVEHYRRALDSLRRVGPALGEDGDPADAETMIHGNLGVALTQLGEGDEAVAAHAAGLRIAEARGMVDAADQARTHLLKARVPHCDWVAREAMLAEILDVDRRRMDRGERPALLPFDTLLVDMPPRARMRHAVYTSRALEHYGDLLPPPAPNAPNGSLRVAYMCYDFNDHPTAHLVEGLFRWHRRFKDAFRSARGPRALEAVAALGYGKDDHSDYRDAIAADADAFINDLALLGHVDAVVASRDFGAQIVVDLQGHTLGTRMELCMARVAPVQLAYLIYPGTSGASCLDGAVVDPIVVPPEAARVYTERLVYLPGTYQVNDYERHAAVATYAAAPDAPRGARPAAEALRRLLQLQQGGQARPRVLRPVDERPAPRARLGPVAAPAQGAPVRPRRGEPRGGGGGAGRAPGAAGLGGPGPEGGAPAAPRGRRPAARHAHLRRALHGDGRPARRAAAPDGAGRAVPAARGRVPAARGRDASGATRRRQPAGL